MKQEQKVSRQCQNSSSDLEEYTNPSLRKNSSEYSWSRNSVKWKKRVKETVMFWRKDRDKV